MRREFRYAISAASAAVLLLFAVLPEAAWATLPVLCPFRRFGGFECLGCGTTRALSAALHGRFAASVTLNAEVVWLLPVLIAGLWLGRRR